MFDVTRRCSRAQNALAVRISPPPHPGIPPEESIACGPGENGGAMALDGPTFIATEGWDWIPAIRDRDSGIWQDVDLEATRRGAHRRRQVITHLPLPDTDQADVDDHRAGRQSPSRPPIAHLDARFEGVIVHKTRAPAARADRAVSSTPSEFPQLTVQHPRLWWPNGYGEPALYTLKLDAATTASALRPRAAALRHPRDHL